MSQNSNTGRPTNQGGMGGGPMGRGGWGAMGRPVEKAKDFWGSLRRLLLYFLPQKVRLSIVLVAAIFGTVFNIVGQAFQWRDCEIRGTEGKSDNSKQRISAKLAASRAPVTSSWHRFWLYWECLVDLTRIVHYQRDFHVHSTVSDGRCGAENRLQTAQRGG